MGITPGTLYQKRFCARDPVYRHLYQYLAARAGDDWLAFMFESRQMIGNRLHWSAVLGLFFGLSVGAVLLLMRMIRSEPQPVASFFLSDPPVTALAIAWNLFGETLDSLGNRRHYSDRCGCLPGGRKPNV